MTRYLLINQYTNFNRILLDFYGITQQQIDILQVPVCLLVFNLYNCYGRDKFRQAELMGLIAVDRDGDLVLTCCKVQRQFNACRVLKSIHHQLLLQQLQPVHVSPGTRVQMEASARSAVSINTK